MTSKPKTTVTFYNGLTTIGGPMIEVAYDKSHVLFDLGEVYRPELGLKMEDENFSTLLKYQLIGDVPNFYDPKITGKEIDHERWQNSAARARVHTGSASGKARRWSGESPRRRGG